MAQNMPMKQERFREAWMKMRSLFTRYVRVGPTVAFLVGAVLGGGGLWQYLDYEYKRDIFALERIRVENELYDRLRAIQNQVSSEIPGYVALRDLHYKDRGDQKIQAAYAPLLSKLVHAIGQYNRIEVQLALLQKRIPRWFVTPVAPLAPKNFRVKKSPDGKAVFTFDHTPEPLITKVREDLKSIFKEHGKPWPSKD